ncbi:MAG: TolC family protein, partial [Bacteroidota bacterium]
MNRILFLLLLIAGNCLGQKQVLSLDSCIQMTKQHYPLIRQNDLISEEALNAINNTNKNWLPHLSFISKAAYQSEVISFQGITFPHDSYITALDLEQSVYDGGENKHQKQLNRLNADGDHQKNQVELYKLIDRMNQLYSSILMT